MAAHERLPIKSSFETSTLIQRLNTILPLGAEFKIYHLSTPPTRTSSIYSAPPGTRADRTYCESHFLTASIKTPAKDGAASQEVLIFAIEVLIYSTAYDTTFFVSKADSTGYLHHLGLSKGTPSPIRDISGTFLRHLLHTHQRPNIRNVVSLFARAQDQYLFPGSIEYSGKHVLDDRGLIRWWCRVLDPLLDGESQLHRGAAEGYLIVPGLDEHETRSYLPRSPKSSQSWTVGHPLSIINRHGDNVPSRCLIPHYPDDPKARFLDELDEEITKGRSDDTGHWKSVKSIDEFWDMMAYRQECSAGRLVGFIWIVFSPGTQQESTTYFLVDSQETDFTNDSQLTDNVFSQSAITSSPMTSFVASSQVHPPTSPLKHQHEDADSRPQQSRTSKRRVPKKKLSGPIVPRQPRIKTENKNYLLDKQENTAYYTWSVNGRGQIVVDESDYKRVTELLLRLDFATLELSTSSTTRWINEVRSGAWGEMRDAWGQHVTGTKPLPVRSETAGSNVMTLNVGLVRKKRKGNVPVPEEVVPALPVPQVNVLAAGMVRKKSKS